MEYVDFLKTKIPVTHKTGISVKVDNPGLFGWQKSCVDWALERGRAALFADTGLGKTRMQLTWAQAVVNETGGSVLILAPLAVAAQTVTEGEKIGISVTHVREPEDVRSGINITNYERLDRFDAEQFTGVVLDESSILKAFDGKTCQRLIESFAGHRFRLACTATPSPNDHMELGTHAEFLSVMNRNEMLSRFFVHDGGDTAKWRLKGHARSDFWRWVASWAMCIGKPSDIGGDDTGYNLPPLNLNTHIVSTEGLPPVDGELFRSVALSATKMHSEMRQTSPLRAAKLAELVSGSDEPWIIWCNTNYEADDIAKLIPEAVEVRGSDTPETKEKRLTDFSNGNIRVLLTKASIAGFGMNWQHCRNMAFMGLSYSYEDFYQAVRRCWRFGQKRQVNVQIVAADSESGILESINRKQEAHDEMKREMQTAISAAHKEKRNMELMPIVTETGENWTVHLGDCVQVARTLPDDSIDFSIFSPPFASLYVYSDSPFDMGNCRSFDEFMTHFRYLVAELYRVTKPGRNLSFHCMNLPTTKQHHGYIGIQDFRGDLIREFTKAGWIFHSEVCIWKDPVTAMQRTKAIGLLHKQLKKDSCISRQGIPDYLVTMRKPGENPQPVSHTNDSFPVDVWQRYASPVWMDINPSDTLQKESAREHNDEKHICPLQLEVIRRALKLWSNPGDLVFSPFTGIGSEGYVSIQEGRRFVGAELKGSYFKQAVANLAIASQTTYDLFGKAENE